MEHDRRVGMGMASMLLVLTVLIIVGVGSRWIASPLFWAFMGLAGSLSFALGYRVLYRLFR